MSGDDTQNPNTSPGSPDIDDDLAIPGVTFRLSNPWTPHHDGLHETATTPPNAEAHLRAWRLDRIIRELDQNPQRWDDVERILGLDMLGS